MKTKIIHFNLNLSGWIQGSVLCRGLNLMKLKKKWPWGESTLLKHPSVSPMRSRLVTMHNESLFSRNSKINVEFALNSSLPLLRTKKIPCYAVKFDR